MAVLGLGGNTPDNPSGDYSAQIDYWKTVRAILGGIETMRAGGQLFLPKFEQEPMDQYNRRLRTSRMTNVFTDIVDDLTQRPFEKPVTLPDNAPSEIVDFAGDVDGRGTDLHVFANELFYSALTDGITFVLVDYSKDTDSVMTVADEKAAGLRPFWCHYKAVDVLAVYSEYIGGEEVLVEVRLREYKIARVGFEEKTVEQIRVFRRNAMGEITWEIWQKKETTVQKAGARTSKQPVGQDQAKLGEEWEIVEGPEKLTLDRIPLVAVAFGERDDWRVKPPLRDAAHLQIELYEQENGLKNIATCTAFPMLAANGIERETDNEGNEIDIVVGPNAVLYGGLSADGRSVGSWAYVEPSGSSLEFQLQYIERTIQRLRELGRQPLTERTPGLTVVSAATAAQKGRAAIHAWVSKLGNAMHNMMILTGLWLSMDVNVTPVIDQDFDLTPMGDDSFTHVLTMARQGIISRPATVEEAKRRAILRPDYDAAADAELINEMTEDYDEDTNNAA